MFKLFSSFWFDFRKLPISLRLSSFFWGGRIHNFNVCLSDFLIFLAVSCNCLPYHLILLICFFFPFLVNLGKDLSYCYFSQITNTLFHRLFVFELRSGILRVLVKQCLLTSVILLSLSLLVNWYGIVYLLCPLGYC